MVNPIVPDPIAFAVVCATLIALVTIAVFSKQGGIQRLDLKIDRNGGQFTIEARENEPPKLPEASEEQAASESDPHLSIDQPSQHRDRTNIHRNPPIYAQ